MYLPFLLRLLRMPVLKRELPNIIVIRLKYHVGKHQFRIRRYGNFFNVAIVVLTLYFQYNNFWLCGRSLKFAEVYFRSGR